MIRLYVLLSFAILFQDVVVAQQQSIVVKKKRTAVVQLLESFAQEYPIHFSYDIERVKKLNIILQTKTISLVEFQEALKKQTNVVLQKIDTDSYLVLQNTASVTLCGVVMASDTGEAIANAEVFVNKKIQRITTTQGSFEVKVQPQDTIRISHIGYQSVSYNARQFPETSCDTLWLTTTTEELNAVVIKEYLTKGIQKRKDASVHVSNKALGILPGLVEPDVLQGLQLLPGIHSPNEDVAALHIRGGTPDQNLVLWDGIKMYNFGHFFDQITTFNPYIIKDVTVFRGGTSVQYGDRISGVIAIESDEDLMDSLKIGGGINMTHADVYVKTPVSDQLGILVAGRRSITDVFQSQTFKNLSKKVFQNTRAEITDNINEDPSRKDEYYFSDVNFKVLWKPNTKQKISLSTIFSENRLDNTSETLFLDQFMTQNRDRLSTTTLGAGIQSHTEYANGVKQRMNVYYSRYGLTYDLDRNKADETTIGFAYENDNSVTDIGAAYQLSIPTARPTDKIHIGYQFMHNSASISSIYNEAELTEQFVDYEDKINNHTVFSEYIHDGTRNYVTVGLRASSLSDGQGIYIEPRLFSSLKITDKIRGTVSVELKNQQFHRIATYEDVIRPEVGSLARGESFWELSNNRGNEDRVPILQSQQYTIGGLYSHKGWHLDIEGYYKKLKGISLFTKDVAFIVAGVVEEKLDVSGKEERYGIDVLVKKRIQNYRFWLGYSWSKTQIQFPELSTFYFPGDFDQRHVFSIAQTYIYHNFEFSLGWNYATGKPFTSEIFLEDFSIAPETTNSARLPDYHRLDASCTYKFTLGATKRWRGMLGLSIRNVYNRQNSIGRQYFGFDEESPVRRLRVQSIHSLSRTPDVIVRIKF